MKFYTNVHLLQNDIHVVGYDNGKRFVDKVRYKPYHFVTSTKNVKTPYKTLNGKPVHRIDFDSIKESRDYYREYQDVRGHEIFGLTNYIYCYLNDAYPGKVDYDSSQINIVNIDIEVAADEGFPDIELASKPITAICMKRGSKIVVFACGEFETDDPNVMYRQHKSEGDLLRDFLDLWSKLEIDVVTGWNVENFDIPYIINRVVNVLGFEYATMLSPHRKLDMKSQNQPTGKETEWTRRGQSRSGLKRNPEILGISTLDYLALYRKFTYVQQESYSLDNICSVELGEKKLDYSEYDGLMSLYKNDHQKFIEYNIRDVVLVDKLDKKLGLLNLAFAIAYDAKVNYVDAFTSVRMWDIIIHNYLLEKNVVVPLLKVNDKERQVEGAFVKDPITGLHKWIVSFDLNSLYPHLIMQYNIGPDTYIGQTPIRYTVDEIVEGKYKSDEVKQLMKEHNVAVTGSGAMYSRDFRSFLSELMEKMYDDRIVAKNQMIDFQNEQEKTGEDLSSDIAKTHNMQMAKKIQLNSAYGALGNQYFRWFDIKYAESITLSGQLSIKWISKHINEFMNKTLQTEGKDYVLACDTDSMYLTLDKLVDRTFEGKDPTTEEVISWMDKVAQQILEPFIDKSFKKLATYVNAYEQKMFMAREALADKGFWTAKKRYALHVHDMEGVRYSEPRLKIMGLETQRSSIPLVCRTRLKESIKLIMEKDEEALIEFIEEFRKSYNQMGFEDIAFPRGCRGINKYRGTGPSIYAKGTPIHVRGALVFNNMLKEHDLQNRYNPVYEGDKVKFCYLKLPNPARENVISITSALPTQFGIENYIDYNTQFDKSFLDPLRTIAEKISWKVERGQATLEDFF